MYRLQTKFIASKIQTNVFKVFQGVIDLVCTHEGEGSSKSVHHVYKREGIDTSMYVCKSPLLHVFCTIFICKILSSYFCLWCQLSVLFYNAVAMNIFLSLKSFVVFLSVESLNGYLKTFLLEIGGSDG